MKIIFKGIINIFRYFYVGKPETPFLSRPINGPLSMPLNTHEYTPE